ncbi:hypothetical protein [Clostridioides difficile]|uniref:hypothetical protein n=1 Tax=Clostridioides difficile TaxID=1496 RepID=UPI001034DF23|nr:hypothetical protein [Clostridioides difficile]
MKIYTYKNSVQLKDAIFWNEIEGAPHFCSSEVLAIGMRKFYGRNTFPCISTIDLLIKELYPNWLKSHSDIERYKDISKLINELNDSSTEGLRQAFVKNKKSILDSCKYLIETEDLLLKDYYNKNIFNKFSAINDIQEVFKEKILKRLLEQIYIDGNKNYWKPEWIDTLWVKSKLSEVIHKCVIKEISDIVKNTEEKSLNHNYDEGHIFEIFDELFDQHGLFNISDKTLEYWKFNSKDDLLDKIGYSSKELEYVRNLATTECKSYKTIVIHGVYHLNPIHLRLLRDLERDHNVIVLNCYNKEFNHIYEFWNDIYDHLIKIFQIPKNNIKIDSHDSANHREVGSIFAEVVNGVINKQSNFFKISRNEFGPDLNLNSKDIDELFNHNSSQDIRYILNKSEAIIQNYEDEDEREYQKILIDTSKELQKELCHRSKILIKYDSTMQFVNKVCNIFDETKNKKGIRSVGRMKEQFYGSKGTEMNKIFQVFYPDEFKVKPFLSYPIGQFIYAIHNMWDLKNHKLILNSRDLAECLNLDVWHDIHPLEVFESLRFYIGIDKEPNGMNVKDFIDRIKKLIYLKERNENKMKNLDNLSYLNLTIDQYNRFIQVIENINEIANKIFCNKSQTSKKHFMDLLEILNDEKAWKPLLEEEKRLMDEIKNQIIHIDDETNKTDLNTIKDTMAYYLDSKEGTDINWLVRDFEQLEGDILSEAANYKNNTLRQKCYHLTMLSNENMINCDIDNLPWPLSDDFIISKNISSFIHTICINYAKYKRCLLFQGLYYLINNPIISLKLSYIENQGEYKHTPYYILNMFMNIGKDFDQSNCRNIESCTSPINKEPKKRFKIDKKWHKDAIESFSCCPYKFMYGYVINDAAKHYKDELQVKMYLGEIIKYYISIAWKKILQYHKKLLLDQKFNLLKKWTAGERLDCLEKSLPETLEPIYGNYFIKSEINKIIVDNLEYLKNKRIDNKRVYFTEECKIYEVDRELYHCWIGKISNHNLYVTNKNKIINIRNRLNLLNANEYINDYILGMNDGWYFKKDNIVVEGGYKVSEHACRYCSYNKICCYQYRIKPIHLLHSKEDLID